MALSNPKHEKFAQELASGKPASAAYIIAGFKANRGNAITLKHRQSIIERIAEILAQREQIHAQATADAIVATKLTKEWVINGLRITSSERCRRHRCST